MLISNGMGHIEKSEEKKWPLLCSFKALDQIPLSNDVSMNTYFFIKFINNKKIHKFSISLSLQLPINFLCHIKFIINKTVYFFRITPSFIIGTLAMDLAMGEEKKYFIPFSVRSEYWRLKMEKMMFLGKLKLLLFPIA